MTPLQRAQAFAQQWAPVRAATVDQLRKAGWTREDAEERADELEAKALAAHEAGE